MAQNPPPNHWDISQVDVSKLPPASDQQGVMFDKDILPLFKTSCVRCHGNEKPKAGLRLDSLEAVLKGGHDGKMVVPGDSKKSLLVAAAARIDDSIAMPPKRRPRGGSGGPPPGAVLATVDSLPANQAVKTAAMAPAMGLAAVPANPVADPEDKADLARRQSRSLPNKSAWSVLGLIKALNRRIQFGRFMAASVCRTSERCRKST